MNTSVPTPEAFIASFPNTTLGKHEGPPTYTVIKSLREQLAENASSIPTTRGDGQHGYLGLVLAPAAYAMVSGGQAFDAPNNPGPTPVIQPNATTAQIAERSREHATLLRDWREYQSIHQALRSQLLDAIDPIYVRAIKQTHVGFANRSVQDILQHLLATYGRITHTDMIKNDETIKQAWDPSLPFEHVVEQVENAVTFATDGNQPYTPQQIITIAYTLVYNTGEYFDKCDTWDAKNAQDKTWDNFKQHFFDAQNKHILRRQTAQQAGFHQANMAAHNYDPTMEALANMAHANAGNGEALATLNNTIATLNAQIQQQTARIQSLELQLDAAKKNTNTNRPTNHRKDQGGYCWTHGYLVHPEHTSATCRKKKPGHQDEATRNNPMGGSDLGKPPSRAT